MDFNKDVVEKSEELPVVVDFWAPWCGPCKVLGPIIEELAEESKEKWTLMKVNSDEHPDLSTQYKVKGIPAVKMFHHGEVIAEFTGALPKNQIETWLTEHLPDEIKVQFADIKKRAELGEVVTEELEGFCKENPQQEEAKIMLARITVFEDSDKALALLDQVSNPHKFLDQIEDLKSLTDFMNCELGQNEMSYKIEKARSAAQVGDFDNALDLLIEGVMVDKDFCNEMPRRATIALFHWLGNGHDITKKYRRKFDMALY